MTQPAWTRGLFAILGFAVLMAVCAACLPDNPYQRWQLIEDTLYENALWSYERVHFDPAPIDVAILGPSRARLGVSAPRIEASLAALGKPAHVANMAVIEDGRNMQWAIADELLRTKPPKVLVMAINEEPHRWGHPGFKYVAPAAAVAWPPAPFLHNSGYDIVYLPYRQMVLFAASLVPDAFGLRTRFNSARYAAVRTDDSVSHRQQDGKWIEMDVPPPREDLIDQARKARALAADRGLRLPGPLARVSDADEPVYVQEIVRAARAHGTRVVFLYIPQFESSPVISNRAFYTQFGRIVDNGDLATRDPLFQGWAHLNHAGAMIVSDRLARALAPML